MIDFININLFLGLSIKDFLFIPGIFILHFIIKIIYNKIFGRIAFFKKYEKYFLSFLKKILFIFFIQSLINLFEFPYKEIVINYIIKGAYYFLTLYVSIFFIKKFEIYFKKKAKKTDSKFDDQIIPFIFSILKVFTFFLFLGIFLSNIGFNITSLIAGLSIGGAAIGFASKDIVSNLFGSLTIFVDKPFQLGDRIKIDGIEGDVEEVGMRVTKIRTFADTIEYVPNSKFTSDLIENVSLMNSRRIKEYIYFEYPEDIVDFKKWKIEIESYIKNDKKFNLLKSNFLHIDKINENGLNIQIYIFTNTVNWGEWKDEKEQLYLKIIEAANKYNLKFSRVYRKNS